MTIGDQFLEILSSRTSMPLGGKDADDRASVGTCLDGLCESAQIQPIDYDLGFRVWLDSLVEIGFARRDYTASRLHVEAPALTMLPTRGADTALLLGARTRSFLETALELASKHGVNGSVMLRTDSMSAAVPAAFWPSRVLFKGEVQAFATFAAELGIRWFPVPLAYLLSRSYASSHLDSAWQDSQLRQGAEWFNSHTLRFDGAAPTATLPLGFCRSEVQNQNGRQRFELYRLQSGSVVPRAAVVDEPRAAKWHVLRQNGVKLAVSPDGRSIAVPLHCPLPVALARAATLCTGEPARIIDADIASALGLDSVVRSFCVYYGLHPVIAADIRSALGVELMSLTCHPCNQ